MFYLLWGDTVKLYKVIVIILILGSLLLQGNIISQPREIPVLNYHMVEDNVDNQLAVTVKDFDDQMSYLYRNGYKSITPDELLSYLKNGDDIPEKSVLITFDDGYRDTYLNAYPILEKYRFTATVFLITDVVGNDDWYLDWDQVKKMHQAGFVIGSHTLSHVPLTTLSRDEALLELQKSKEKIEGELGTTASYFAYPTGAYNDEVLDLVKKVGYKAAFSVQFGKSGQNSNIYELERIPIFRSTWAFYDFYLRLHFTSLVEKARWIKKEIMGETLVQAN
ncbi:MAG: pgaB 3 [Firmicutes bacterium]|nr:pgaB 3 [Bacillota bacterium]